MPAIEKPVCRYKGKKILFYCFTVFMRHVYAYFTQLLDILPKRFLVTVLLVKYIEVLA